MECWRLTTGVSSLPELMVTAVFLDVCTGGARDQETCLFVNNGKNTYERNGQLDRTIKFKDEHSPRGTAFLKMS